MGGTASAVVELPMATPESRRRAGLGALREAIQICIDNDGCIDECLARLAEAEDRFNRVLAEQLVEAFQTYAPHILAESPIGRPTLCIGDDPDRTPMKALRDGSVHFYDLETGAERPSVVLDDFVVLGRSPCHTLAPRNHWAGAMSYPLSQRYTGRHPVDEARMWSSWWTTCADGLATSWDTLIDLAGPCPAPMDARFCKGGLALARLLLDLGAQRADQDVRHDSDFKSNWATSHTGRGKGPAPPRAWAEYEEGILEGDHERCHWAAMSKREGDDYLTQRVRVRLDRWHLMRAMLVTTVALLERLYNTHAIYAALGIGALEHRLIERDVPRTLYDPNTIGGGDDNGSKESHGA
ncbi:hypothetical protein TW95_gp0696 [Pandoravirus inopinatum]|uniref:Uncharacterized protein n=1 Tax=Pandoravirus inopinatum TaxID=1605721 RepID=A0A0B5J6N3_9VIRU|nr:hypothetical protein TW95_gp0696 [Pandoravirus inopinatum]AJF97430.1 hypothetical protein [Pandoravirus inopinatum]